MGKLIDCSLWFGGPDFLRCGESYWQSSFHAPEVPGEDREIIKSAHVVIYKSSDNVIVICSSLSRAGVNLDIVLSC